MKALDSASRSRSSTTPSLTIGMAVFNDFDGVWFTIQALRLYQDLTDCEIVVIDNAPHTPHGKATRQFIVDYASKGACPARYIPFTKVNGTAAPRDLLFSEAEGRAVLCIDPHVLLTEPDTIQRLKAYYDQLPNQRGIGIPTPSDLFQGPMYFDDIRANHIATHFSPTWGAQMYGQWADDPRGRNPNNNPFPILGMGLGLFTCRKDAWLGFNPAFRGFGGEEMYIHEKYRQAGNQCWCLPWLRWLHRFPRPGGIPYPLTRWHKVRNYILGRQELGLPLDDVYEHFVASKLFSQEHWDYLVADPVARKLLSRPRPSQRPPIQGTSLEGLYEAMRGLPRDLNEHFPKLRELAARCTHVTEVTQRRESIVPLAAGLASSSTLRDTQLVAIHPVLISYSMESDSIYAEIHKAAAQLGTFQRLETNIGYDPLAIDPIEDTDLLFLNSHSGNRMGAELIRHAAAARRYIVLHNTTGYGDRGDDGGQGTKSAVYNFLSEHPDWYLFYRTDAQYGLTVLACQPKLDSPYQAGVGASLKYILRLLGINPQANCNCNSYAEQMNAWGVQGCRNNRSQIIAWLREGQDDWGWTDKLTAGVEAIKHLLVLNPLNPFPGLVDTAIRRTEAAQLAMTGT